MAEFFLKNIFLRHGPPRVLLSDRGRVFLSAVLGEVLRAAETVHRTTSSYHPQTNGLTERFHRTLSDMISSYIQPDHKNWDIILPFVTYAYNTAVQSTTGFSPFFLVYGRQPASVLDTSFLSAPVLPRTNIPDEFISRLDHTRHLARLRTTATQEERKANYDATHRVVSFKAGDEVLLSTPLRAPGLCEKFLPRYIGPYTIVEQTSPVNYRVTPNASVTDRRCRGPEIVHVSRLKPFFSRSTHS